MAGTPGITSGARTPEELETLFEDALLVRDHQVLTALFESGATLVMSSAEPVRGGEAIARAALASRNGIGAYVADPRRVLLARNSALVVTDRGVNVMHRGDDGAWRYAIVVQTVLDGSEGTERRHKKGSDRESRCVSTRHPRFRHWKAELTAIRSAGNGRRARPPDPPPGRRPATRSTSTSAAGGEGSSPRCGVSGVGAAAPALSAPANSARKIMASLAPPAGSRRAQVEDLAQIDQSPRATRLRPPIRRAPAAGLRVLDVSGGLGGPARLLAHDAACSVTVLISPGIVPSRRCSPAPDH